jgi:hypothetical protein
MFREKLSGNTPARAIPFSTLSLAVEQLSWNAFFSAGEELA